MQNILHHVQNMQNYVQHNLILQNFVLLDQDGQYNIVHLPLKMQNFVHHVIFGPVELCLTSHKCVEHCQTIRIYHFTTREIEHFATHPVVGNKISLFRLSSKTKSVADDSHCRWQQCQSLATMLVVSDEPKYYVCGTVQSSP